MKTRLIILDGPSTVGKSSLSKSIYHQLKERYHTKWLHEECSDHPIGTGEFEKGDLTTAEGMEKNRKHMITKWSELAKRIQEEDTIYILEGCFLHALDRYLIGSVWTEKEIDAYFVEIGKILEPLHPFFVFLHREDLRQSFEKAFQARGNWWKDLILKAPEPCGYFKNHPYTGEESIFESIHYEQQQMDRVFQRLSGHKLKMETSEENWKKYTEVLLKALGVPYEEKNLQCQDIQSYVGTYESHGGHRWSISWDAEKKLLYSSLFWPYMPMEVLGDRTLGLLSFPVTLRFSDTLSTFQVEGNYDWDLNGELYHKR
ncbi:hypothetical protein [Proteiniclasticum ruminis]|uniref:Uncharacterized protein n=1 Tax=Proteiniclasticum ruminis TaxID=398199 RepID=A0A1I4XIW1_9CLOT|nr:hypothetical protein [Proteiniclasticum ruminis]SFN25811.1 hypothetical protein SAMN04488695_10119 [Proteiniclasticum ruminis]